MNWKRGLLRFWIVCAIAWFLAVLFLLNPIGQIYGVLTQEITFTTKNGVKHVFPARTDIKVVKETIAKYLTDEQSKWPGTPDNPFQPFVEAEAIIEQNKPVSALSIIGKFTLLACLPPLGLLLSGLATFWIVLGFKPPSSN
jgi:hypothetical protein